MSWIRRGPRASKYGNIPVVSRHTGRRYHSKMEAAWEPVLLAQQNAGLISDLQMQAPKFRLDVYSTQAVDALLAGVRDALFRNPSLERLAVDVERSRQHITAYIPDFVFMEHATGQQVVQDVKGAITETFKLKQRLMLACHGIEVELIQKRHFGGVQQKARGAGIKGRGTGSRLKGGR